MASTIVDVHEASIFTVQAVAGVGATGGRHARAAIVTHRLVAATHVLLDLTALALVLCVLTNTLVPPTPTMKTKTVAYDYLKPYYDQHIKFWRILYTNKK